MHSAPGRFADRFSTNAWPLEQAAGLGVIGLVKNSKAHETWPGWANWALLAVVATSVLTIAAAINDIW